MTQDEYVRFANKELSRLQEIIKQKSADYSGGSDDALANFRLSEQLGLADAEIGLLIRLVDKIQRIKSFLAKGSLEVPNESAQDAARDIIGYSVALLALLEDKKPKSVSGVITVQSGIGTTMTIAEEEHLRSHGFISINRKSGAV